MSRHTDKAEYDFIETIKHAVSQIGDYFDWHKVDDIVREMDSDENSCRVIRGEWGCEHWDATERGLGILIEDGVMELMLDKEGVALVRMCMGDHTANTGGNAWDRVYGKARLTKLETDFKELKDQVSKFLNGK